MMRFIFFVLIFSLHISAFSQRVLILGIDGMRSNVSEIANTPGLDNLKAEGLYSLDALNDDITISGPGWSAIVCGVLSPKHNVTNNNFSGNNYASYPSFFERIENENPSLNTVSICNWSPINNSIIQDDADVIINVSNDQAVENEVVNQLQNADPHVIFAHLDEVDHAGHAHGFAADVPEYIDAIEDIDTHVANIFNALKARPNFQEEDWLILVTSDHGGLGFSHGGNSMEERNVIFIVSGTSVSPLEITKDSIIYIDTTQNCLNDSLELTFDGTNDFAQIPYNPSYDFGEDGDFTVECRVKTSIAADVAIVGNKDWDSGNNKGFVFSFKFSSGPEWKVNIGDGSNRVDLNTGGAIADNKWYTLSASFDRDGMMKIYQDGSFLDEINMSSVGNIDNTNDLFFGTDINQDYDYNGSIAEVRIWDKVLPTQEISDFACDTISSSHPSYANLIGYWRMNEGTGTQIHDQSVNANHGTINNAQWYSPDTIWQDDYSSVPKIEDISISALSHLCIPIDIAWSLDGQSWVPDCVYNDKDCANPGYNNWVGPNQGFWHNAANWSRGFIPKICDNVIIPDGFEVTILAGKTAECNSISVVSASQLIIEDGASLTVQDE